MTEYWLAGCPPVTHLVSWVAKHCSLNFSCSSEDTHSSSESPESKHNMPRNLCLPSSDRYYLKHTPFCFIWPPLMGSYLVFSAYLFLMCGLRVMCLPNLIISDPDFHLHVGGLLNPIPGKLFTISPVCVRSFLKSSSVLRSLLEAISASDVNAEYLECTLTSTQLYIEWKDVHTQTCTNSNTRRNTHLSCSLLPVFLPLFLCLLIVLYPNPMCSLQFHLKTLL